MRVPLPYLVLFGGTAAVMVFFTGPARLIRGHGAAGAGLGEVPAAYEEALRARSHGAHCEIRTQAEREAPTGSPDGPRPGTGKA